MRKTAKYCFNNLAFNFTWCNFAKKIQHKVNIRNSYEKKVNIRNSYEKNEIVSLRFKCSNVVEQLRWHD